MHNHPAAPTRRTSKRVLTFGDIHIPVDIFLAETPDVDKVKRSLRSRITGNVVGRKNYDTLTGEVVATSDIEKVYVFDDMTEVSLSDDEIKSTLGAGKDVGTIVAFIPKSKADELYPVKHFQVRPHNPGRNKIADPEDLESWALLTMAMHLRESVAIVRLAQREREQFYMLSSDGRMAQVLPDQAVRGKLPTPPISVSGELTELALKLHDAMSQDDVPELVDTNLDRVVAFADAKLTALDPDHDPRPADSADLIRRLTKAISSDHPSTHEVTK